MTMAEPTITRVAPVALGSRIDAMYKKDCIAALTLVVVLWLTVFFVILSIRPYMPSSVEIACWISAGILLLFNTSSIIAMVRHYGEDKEHIYEIDIRHLDAGR
jgi:protein-S-isoprenylcysteine O-methyltransferase Ste14